MSEAIQNSDTPSPCDRLLDYVYGELSGDDLEQFKLHLLTCDPCKRELAGLERVRSAVKQALPAVEPPVDKMAQLMHAAAQQKPKRGKVLMFVRRTVSHPAYAAAAVFVLVATAVTVNYSRNALEMPKPAVHEPVPVVAAPEPAAQPPLPAGAAPATPAETPKGQVWLDGVAKDATKEGGGSGGIVLKTEPPGAYTVRKAPPAKKISSGNADEVVFEPIANGYKTKAKEPPKAPEAKPDPAFRRDQSFGSGSASGKNTRHADVAADDAKQEEVQLARPADKPAAPPPPAAPKPAEKRESYNAKSPSVAGGERGRITEMESSLRQAPAKETSMGSQNQAVTGSAAMGPASAPAQAAPPTVAVPSATTTPQAAPPLTESKSLKNSVDNTVSTRQQKSVDPTLLKKQFLTYAQSNRCTEAVSTFQQLDRQYSGLLSVNDRLEYVKCLRQAGQNSLADLENKAIAEEQQKVNAARSKKAKPARNAVDEKAAPATLMK